MGWWLPGGKLSFHIQLLKLIEPPEKFEAAAIREAKEEGGIDIDLKGILRFEY